MENPWLSIDDDMDDTVETDEYGNKVYFGIFLKNPAEIAQEIIRPHRPSPIYDEYKYQEYSQSDDSDYLSHRFEYPISIDNSLISVC